MVTIIYIYIISASLSMATANAGEMGGLYIGLGANVGYDEYDARANVGQSGAYGVTVQNTANSTDVNVDNDLAGKLVNGLWECGKNNGVLAEDINDDPEVTIVSSKEIAGEEEIEVYRKCSCCAFDSLIDDVYALSDSGDDCDDLECNLPCQGELYDIRLKDSGIPTSGYYYKAESDIPISGGAWDGYYKVKVYKETFIPKSTITPDQATYLMSQSLHRSGHNAGGEMKMAYFHDFGNHIMAGLDLTGAVLSKNRRDIQVSKFNVNNVYPDLTLKSNGNTIATATHENNGYTANVIGEGTIEAGKSLTLSSNYEDFKSAVMQENPGMQVTTDPIKGEYLDVSNNDKEVSFEKGIFNPKLAFVVGGTYKGWFAGLRAGVSYNTGKVKTQEMTETKSVSVASPLVGVQVMKKVSDNTNLYMTADWNVGDLRKSVDINGIKSFKQSSYNISAGVQWKCSFLK